MAALSSESVSLKIHPRAIAALGADLVTNDLVAVIELVKNAYDAGAKRAWVRFKQDEVDRKYLEIEDNGVGMTKETITDAWCVIATPYKTNNTNILSRGRKRRVTGEKGLGRLSAARLGSKLTMLTQASGQPCYELHVDWKDLARQTDLSECSIELSTAEQSPFKHSGTLLRIYNLQSEWGEEALSDLEDNLARLLAPLFSQDEFSIILDTEKGGASHELKIKPPAFLSYPKYKIEGSVDAEGDINAEYIFTSDVNPRRASFRQSWENVLEATERRDRAHRGV